MASSRAGRGRSGVAEVTDLAGVLAAGTSDALETWLRATRSPRQRADQIEELSGEQVRAVAELLDLATGVELFDDLEAVAAARVVALLSSSRAAGLLDALDPDVASEVLRALRPERRDDLLRAMEMAHSAVVRGLLAWPEESAAAQMTPHALTVRPGVTAGRAMTQLRERGAGGRADSHTAAYVYVTDEDDHLHGVVSFQALVFAAPETLVGDLMDGDVATVRPLDDQEVAAALLTDLRLLAVPVVDEQGVLLGIITADDIVDILAEETTEDAERQGGSEPLDVPYLQASPWLLWRKRIVWLLVLFVAEMYTGTVLRHFEDELAQVVALTFFIPLLIGTGGNSGTQITTTLVRAMATGEVRLRNVLLVVRKEMSTAALIAVTMSLFAWLRALTLGVDGQVALTVTLTVCGIVLWSALVASILPLVLKRLRLDPAVVSAPMIATIVDGTGLIIYFTIAKLVIDAIG